MQNFLIELSKKVQESLPQSHEEVNKLKRSVAKSLGADMPIDQDLLAEYRRLVAAGKLKQSDLLERFLTTREVRTLSGIAPIGVHTKPFPCPGKCIYCPTEPGMPKSYLSTQPAVMRAISNEFDPYRMVDTRIKMLEQNGHSAEKCELIVMGGTWSFFPHNYQEAFLKRCYDGFNQRDAKDITEAKKINETAKYRMVGMTLETRPDYIDEEEVRRWRFYGATRAELGIQHLDEKVLEANRRGHGQKEDAYATKLLKDAGFKITYHTMPGMLGSKPDLDEWMYEEMFGRADFQPDQIKVYPTLVNKYTILYQKWKAGEFEPYDTETLLALVPRIKKHIPPYVRIPRLFRDIPGTSIEAGSKTTNLRQLAQEQMRKRGERCACIRCREPRNKEFQLEDMELVVREYDASGGKEVFLSFESPDRNTIYAFLRLRFPSQLFSGEKHFLPVLQDAALVREVHTYGKLVAPGKHEDAVQHVGLGKRLMAEAEKRAKEFGVKKLAVISGVGVREYYRKLGYTLEDEYMVKAFILES